jgi:WD40 repeat protein
MRGMGVLNQIESVFMIGGDSNVVYSYDVNTRELIDVWCVGSRITSIASISLEDGGFIVAAGTEEGKIAIRQDWEELTRRNECGSSQILDIQFSKTGTIIAAASQDQSVYLLEFKETEYQPLVGIK